MVYRLILNIFENDKGQYRKVLGILPLKYIDWLKTVYIERGFNAMKRFIDEHKYEVSINIKKTIINDDDRMHEEEVIVESPEPFFAICETNFSLELHRAEAL